MGSELFVYLYDGSIDGMLHAVAAAFKSGQRISGIFAESTYQSRMFITEIPIKTEHEQALRLIHYLQNRDALAVHYALNGFLSEDKDAATHIYRMLIALIRQGAAISMWYTHDSVRYLAKLSQRVTREVHRFAGLIRFRILDDGLQYAPFAPDCNVIGYCANHFRSRLRNTRWVLHDTRRNLALLWNRTKLQDIHINQNFTQHVQHSGEIPDDMLTGSEKFYQDLWQSFHRAISNSARENLLLQRQRMPRRYWKYLVEMP